MRIAVRLNKFSAKNSLIRLVKAELKKAHLPVAQINSLLKRIRSEEERGVGIARGTRHILFDIGSDQIEYWHYLGNRLERHDWLRQESVPFANLISDHITQIESDPATGEKMFLEFFITFDEGDDRHDFDQWEHSPSYLGCCYPVVVRWRDRTISRRPARPGSDEVRVQCTDLIRMQICQPVPESYAGASRRGHRSGTTFLLRHYPVVG